MGVGAKREKSVCVYYDFSLSWERRIETMDLFVWELGGEEKRVYVYYAFPLQGENDRNYEFVCMGVGGRREKSVCLL